MKRYRKPMEKKSEEKRKTKKWKECWRKQKENRIIKQNEWQKIKNIKKQFKKTVRTWKGKERTERQQTEQSKKKVSKKRKDNGKMFGESGLLGSPGFGLFDFFWKPEFEEKVCSQDLKAEVKPWREGIAPECWNCPGSPDQEGGVPPPWRWWFCWWWRRITNLTRAWREDQGEKEKSLVCGPPVEDPQAPPTRPNRYFWK